MSSAYSAPPRSKASEPLDAVEESGDAEKNFQLKSAKFWLIIVGIYLSIFIVALDRLIVATAILRITDEFHSVGDIGWYGSAYMLTAAIFNPLCGRIYQLYSTKWVFLASIVTFEVGSTLCGAAPSSSVFIVGRAIAGIGAAGVFVGGTMIIIPLVPLRRRPIFTSFFGMAFGISSVLGPLVGGAFTDKSNLTWRWCFYLNLPVGAFTFLVVLLFFQLESRPRKKLNVLDQLKRLDPLGLLFLVPSMLCLILALQWGGTTDPWSAPKIIGLLVAFVVLFIAFLTVEGCMPETAMAPSRVVLNRSVGSSMLFMLLIYGGMISNVYYLTIWFQAAQGQSALEAGIRTLPMLLSMTVMGIAAAVFVEKVGYYVPPMLVAPVLCATGSGLLSTLTPNAGSNLWIGYQVIYAIGIGGGFQTSTLVPQTVLPRTDVPLGVAMMFFMQQLGGAVFLSVGQNVFSSHLVDSLSDVAGLNASTIVDTGATALRSVVPTSELETVVGAYSSALTRVFVFTAALSACTILCVVPVEWKNIKKKKSSQSNTDEANVEDGKSEVNAEGSEGKATK